MCRPRGHRTSVTPFGAATQQIIASHSTHPCIHLQASLIPQPLPFPFYRGICFALLPPSSTDTSLPFSLVSSVPTNALVDVNLLYRESFVHFGTTKLDDSRTEI